MSKFVDVFNVIVSPSARAAFSPLARATVLIVGVFIIGTSGYWFLSGPEYGLFDAVYMTAITLTTVGYSETIDLASNTPARAFTLVLLVTGVGTFVYFFTTLTAFIIEGSLDQIFVKHRMRRHIASLQNHFIICGAGHTGQHVVDELVASRRAIVLIEKSAEMAHSVYDTHGGSVPVVVGDAAEDDTLTSAGIDRATGLVTCFSNDKDNLIVAFSARALNPSLRIICRATDAAAGRKMERAGADAVVSPNLIGGLRMVSELTRPKAVSFLDAMLREGDDGMRVEDVTVKEGADIAGLTLRDLRKHKLAEVLVVAVHDADDNWKYNPNGDTVLTPGTSVVFIGTPEVRARLHALATPGGRPL
ncbi:MAG: voltage-gated potassium channel [Bradymonadia bacterium]|jgi:voltage-gated potassium channel